MTGQGVRHPAPKLMDCSFAPSPGPPHGELHARHTPLFYDSSLRQKDFPCSPTSKSGVIVFIYTFIVIANKFRSHGMPRTKRKLIDSKSDGAIIEFHMAVGADTENVSFYVWADVWSAKRSNVMSFSIKSSIAKTNSGGTYLALIIVNLLDAPREFSVA